MKMTGIPIFGIPFFGHIPIFVLPYLFHYYYYYYDSNGSYTLLHCIVFHSIPFIFIAFSNKHACNHCKNTLFIHTLNSFLDSYFSAFYHYRSDSLHSYQTLCPSSPNNIAFPSRRIRSNHPTTSSAFSATSTPYRTTQHSLPINTNKRPGFFHQAVELLANIITSAFRVSKRMIRLQGFKRRGSQSRNHRFGSINQVSNRGIDFPVV